MSDVGPHTLTFYAVDNAGNNEAAHGVVFNVAAADVAPPVTSFAGPANGATLPYGSTIHITLTSADAGSGMASLYYIVDGGAPVVVTSSVKNGVRSSSPFGAPSLGVPQSHAGGTAANITTGNLSCIAAGCHHAWSLPISGTIDHTGVTTGCTTCHTVVDAVTVVEPASHALHSASWDCGLCHGTSLTAPVMPSDNGGTHFLGSEPDANADCGDCHTFAIGSPTPVSTASTITTAFDVSGTGAHTIVYWGVDKTGNGETHHSLSYAIVGPHTYPVPTNLTIGAGPTSVKLPAPFVLSGLLQDAPVNGVVCAVMVKKPNRSYFSYSSARSTYNAGMAPATANDTNWWYRYTPTMKGTYRFYITFAGAASGGIDYGGSSSGQISVTVK